MILRPIFVAVLLFAAPALAEVSGELPPVPATIASCLVPGCDAEGFIEAAIEGANWELRVQAYNFTLGPIADALRRAEARGVDVAVLVDKTVPCERNGAAEELRQAGIPVAIDRTVRIAHNKVVIIDRDRIIEGSFNFSMAAMHNAENTNLVVSPGRALDYLAQWQRRAAVSVPYTGVDACPSKRRAAAVR